jgi:hypothetical protein
MPVYESSDVAFQWVMTGTQAEMDALCQQDGSEIVVSIVEDCDQPDLIVFSERPQRFRLSDTQVLYNWPHGVPDFDTVVSVNKCFKIKVTYGAVSFCTNCFERIADDCFTSVIEYGSEADSFGFKYCYGGDMGGTPEDNCDPTTVQFVNVETLAIPYTAGLKNKYGVIPTVQVWVFDESGQLVNMGVQAGFDAYPPTMINLNFGGPASGIVVIR